MWWAHFTFEEYRGYVILMKILRDTIAMIYPSTVPRYGYGVGLWTQTYPSIASINQAFQPLYSAWEINGLLFVINRHDSLTPDYDRDAYWFSGRIWNNK